MTAATVSCHRSLISISCLHATQRDHLCLSQTDSQFHQRGDQASDRQPLESMPLSQALQPVERHLEVPVLVAMW